MSDALRTFSSAGRLALGRLGLLGSRRRTHEDQAGAGGPRGRLFRKYVLLFIGLVSLVLLLNSALDFWFTYDENKAALFRIQQEKAGSAARRIEQFVDEIEHQLGWTTAPQWATAPLEQRRFDYVRLLRQVPAITELIQLDDLGKEQLKVSRLAIDVVGSEKDYSQSPSFTEAKKHRVWFSPVYFRKESEPYMTLAMGRAGRNAGVTIAEVNLKLIWDVITGLKIGQAGYAYVVDREGRLIAHPDISLVLRNTELSNLPQVAAAHAEAPGGQSASPAVMVAKGIYGNSVLTAHAAIAPLGWTVFVELPLNEALAPLYGAALRTAALLILALGLATLAALFLARRMVGPIRLLQAGAARIGAGELDRRIDIQTGDELEGLAGEFNRMAQDLQKSYADLEKKVEDRTAELKEALDQQTATAEVLGVINSSPSDLAPVFSAILEKAHGLCGITFGTLQLYDGEKFRAVATRGFPEPLEKIIREPYAPELNGPLLGLINGGRFVQIPDLAERDTQVPNRRSRVAVDLGIRTLLFLPLRKDHRLLGLISAARKDAKLFSEREMALLENFSAQAVIAMENARLITETREALEQQTATAEVLQVINSSPGELAPVFQSIVENAHMLCGAACGSLQLWDGEKFRGVAMRGFSEPMVEQLRAGYSPSDMPCQSLVEGERVVHCLDLAQIDSPVAREGGVKLGGVRTILYVALRKDDVLLGQIVAARQEVLPFSDKQIALLENFAAQAVIAMENARLITETREALEQRTATAEVLGVINSSPGDVAPVFDAIFGKAHTLCGAAHGSLTTYDGEYFRAVALRGMPEPLADLLRQPFLPSAGGSQEGLLQGDRLVHIPDITTRAANTPIQKASIEAGIRTLLIVPLRKDGALLGYITANRREVRPFSDKQIALLQNFAAQAVIAMENARLITETREALEQQTATAEVLGVINSSPGDLAPVFEAMLEKATRLCEAPFGILRTWDGERFHFGAVHGDPRFCDWVRQRGPIRPGRDDSLLGRIEGGERVVRFADARDEVYRTSSGFREMVEASGIRSAVTVALHKDDALLGIITVYRQEVRPFSDKQIALLQNFATQAVIAMENARLITETREALEQQTATAEVLGVINSSPGELAPVFDAILEKAHGLCGADLGVLFTHDGERFWPVAAHGVSEEFSELMRDGFRPSQGNPLARVVEGEPLVHIADITQLAAQRPDDPGLRVAVEIGLRTFLVVPLRKDGLLLGAISANRREVRPFSDKQIALLQNFAAQAVIAMENARLLGELRGRTRDLQESLEYQTATSDVLKVISQSGGKLDPVLDTLLETGARLCRAEQAVIALKSSEDGLYHYATSFGYNADFKNLLVRNPMAPGRGALIGRTALEAQVVHIEDAVTDLEYTWVAALQYGRWRTGLGVPLLRDGSVVGVLALTRTRVERFTEKHVELVKTFADQAVIAMENARLITETHEALEQQTATAEVLQVINSSPGDLAPVFETILEKAHTLCGAAHGALGVYDSDYNFRLSAARGYPEPLVERFRQGFAGLTNPVTRPLIDGARYIQIPDLADIDHPIPQAVAKLGGFHTGLFIPLRKDDRLLGHISAARSEVRPFAEKEIALLENFAAQAVIAMENARLITETREALEQQTATAEVLGVINSSPGNLAPVFDAMLEKALQLCGAAFGVLWTYDGEAMRAAASRGAPSAYAEFLAGPPRRPGPVTAHGRLMRGATFEHIVDVAASEDYRLGDPFPRALVDLGGGRTILAVPLRKDDAFLGDIFIYRQEVRPFSDKQIALLENFAAQAVIAMENVRLITELRESLEYQTATSDVLRVISGSVFDLDPVLQSVVSTAIRLCRADQAVIYRNVDGEYRWAAGASLAPEYERLERDIRIRPGTGTLVGRAALEAQTVHILDALTDPLYEAKEDARIGGVHTMIGVPLLREGAPIGVIGLARQRVEPFSEREIQLVTTFADQAVIAIENARLLNDLQQRTRDLQESLEYQTATSDLLKVISRSGAELRPMLRTLVETATRICRADNGLIFQLQDGQYHMAASVGFSREFNEHHLRNPTPRGRRTVTGRVAIEGRVVHIEDAQTDPEYMATRSRELGQTRTMLGVPLFRSDTVAGVITLSRSRVEPFSEEEIALVSTFADQAVIAIENARLFNELRARTSELGRSVDELKMLSEVGQAVSSTLDLRSVLSTILTSSLGLTRANAGAIFRYSRAERAFRLVEAVGWDEALMRSVGDLRLAETETAMGEAVARRMPVQLADTAQRASNPLRDLTLAAGFHSALIVPLLGAERILGAILLMRQEAGEFPPETVRLMQTLASQSVLAIQNARMFREIADKSEQLALASQHKSQFLANMSHELRTPLNAILGYAELLVDGIYGVLPDRPKGVLERIQNNGRHLLALINDVLDLAKIEAGQLTLTLEDYSLPEVVRSVVTATEPLATGKGLKFTASLQEDMPKGHGDARRLSQVLLNLVGNAIKFTDEGEVEIRAAAAGGQFKLTVRDTGPGIADADQDRIFGEFQQIDNSNTRQKGGTGLGLAISKRMVEMQGGTIVVEFVLGQGSTFRVVLPVHVDEMMEAAE